MIYYNWIGRVIFIREQIQITVLSASDAQNQLYTRQN